MWRHKFNKLLTSVPASDSEAQDDSNEFRKIIYFTQLDGGGMLVEDEKHGPVVNGDACLAGAAGLLSLMTCCVPHGDLLDQMENRTARFYRELLHVYPWSPYTKGRAEVPRFLAVQASHRPADRRGASGARSAWEAADEALAHWGSALEGVSSHRRRHPRAKEVIASGREGPGGVSWGYGLNPAAVATRNIAMTPKVFRTLRIISHRPSLRPVLRAGCENERGESGGRVEQMLPVAHRSTSLCFHRSVGNTWEQAYPSEDEFWRPPIPRCG